MYPPRVSPPRVSGAYPSDAALMFWIAKLMRSFMVVPAPIWKSKPDLWTLKA